jgi:hypothetical protein
MFLSLVLPALHDLRVDATSAPHNLVELPRPLVQLLSYYTVRFLKSRCKGTLLSVGKAVLVLTPAATRAGIVSKSLKGARPKGRF